VPYSTRTSGLFQAVAASLSETGPVEALSKIQFAVLALPVPAASVRLTCRPKLS
jgi:hypothetical protein